MSLPISFRQIEYVLAINETGSFSAAAKKCYVSQPSLSEAVQKLELDLKIVLFDRNKNPLQITEIGKIFLAQAKVAYDECFRLTEVADNWNDNVQGHFRLGLIPTVAPALIPLFLKPFRQKYPLVKIEIIEMGTDFLLKKLAAGEIDAAILSTPASAPEHLTERPLYYEGFLIYAAKGNSLLHEPTIKFPDLEDQNLILMDETHCVRDQILSICERKKDHSNKTTVHGGLHTLLTVVDEENGFTLIPEMLANMANKNQLRELKPANFRRKISLLTSKSRLKKRIIDLLITEILTNLPSHIPQRMTQKMQVLDPNKKMF